jgi:hypothetical protein
MWNRTMNPYLVQKVSLQNLYLAKGSPKWTLYLHGLKGEFLSIYVESSAGRV